MIHLTGVLSRIIQIIATVRLHGVRPAFHASCSRTGQPRELLVPSSRRWVSSGGESWRSTLPRGTRPVFKTPGRAALRPAPSSPPPLGWASEPLVQRRKAGSGDGRPSCLRRVLCFQCLGMVFVCCRPCRASVFSLSTGEKSNLRKN